MDSLSSSDLGNGISGASLDLTPSRQIRNINFCRQDLEPLLPNQTQKISATTIDAYAAVIQRVSDSSESSTPASYCFFSSRIAALSAGLVKPMVRSGESIESHVLAAVS